MKKLLLVLALIVAVFAGCIEEEPSTEDLKTMMVESVENVDTCKFTLDMNQTTTIVNLTGSNETKSMTIYSNYGDEGIMNVTGKSMWMAMNTTTMDLENTEDNFTMNMEMYMQGDTIYMKLGKNWTKIPGIPEAMWNQQNQLKTQMEMFNHSKVEVVGSEKIDGQDAYKLKIVPDMETFSEILVEQVGSMPLYGMNLTNLYKNSEMNYVTWLSKDTHLPLKVQTEMTLTITPETMNLPAETADFAKMITDINVISFYYDYNQPVVIELPEEARDAANMSSMYGMMGQ
ncbi:MAG: DUF6612 family protein [Methanotrichaceae archaeon]